MGDALSEGNLRHSFITSLEESMSVFIEYLSGIGPLELVGVGGFICYFFAFGAVQFGILDGNSAAYSIANIAAAVMVSISLISEFNLSSALIQGSWIAIGFSGLILRARKAWIASQSARKSSVDVKAT